MASEGKMNSPGTNTLIRIFLIIQPPALVLLWYELTDRWLVLVDEVVRSGCVALDLQRYCFQNALFRPKIPDETRG